MRELKEEKEGGCLSGVSGSIFILLIGGDVGLGFIF
jgi:hypothetical protein